MNRRMLDRLSDLSGKVALVTGAAGHLGQLFCRLLLEQGAKVYGVDRPSAIANLPEQVIPLACELADDNAVQNIYAKIAAEGRLDILVNNAAFVGTDTHQGWGVSFEDQSVETWRNCLEVNLTVPFALVQCLTPFLKQNDKGVVINVGSIYGSAGPDWSLYAGTAMANPAAYGVSKGGLHQLTRWLATTLAPSIRVNALVPGGIFRNQPESFVSAYCQRTPLKRMAKEEDMAGAFLYLCSDMSGYVTGQELHVDGGLLCW